MQTTNSNAHQLLAAGIAAAQAGDHGAAFGLLADLLRADGGCTTAWLWLSSVTSDPAERRYCLDQVLASYPDHAAARRGLSLLPAVAPLNPLRQESAPIIPPALLTQASPATGATIQLDPLAAGLMQPAAPAFFTAPATAAAGLAATPEPSAEPFSQEQIAFALRQFSSGYDDAQAARNICERQGMTWDRAQELVRYVKIHKAVALARGQSPTYIVLGIITLIGGILLTLFYGSALIELASHPYPLSPRVISRWIGLTLTGMSMTIGGVIGLFTTMRSLWR